MRLLLDENLSIRICPRLVDAGHDAVHVLDVGLGSADDRLIVEYAREHGAVASLRRDRVRVRPLPMRKP